MTGTTSRRSAVPSAATSRTAMSTRRRYRRVDWLVLRWQARLDARWADRVVPWAAFGVLFAVYLTAALARTDRLGGGADLARAVQAAWHLAAGRSPETTIGEHINLFALRLPVAFVPLGALTRILPATGTLLAAQAGGLALGAVPVWHLARKVANLRVGAAMALVFAYGLHPAIADLDLGDFHPATMALTPLLVAAYAAERRRWGRFTVASILAVAWSSELGLVIAGIGVVLIAERERRVGATAVALGLGWTVFAVFAVQGPLGTGLVSAGAFQAYGDTGLDVLIEMVRDPFHLLRDLVTDENVRTTIWILAPLLFLPILALRKLAPALPLQALYFIADVPTVGASGGGRTVPLVAFTFVAAPFALARLGRRNIDRVLVDRHLLVLVACASAAALLTASALAPGDEPWRREGPREEAFRAAAAAVPPLVATRAPGRLATELAERRRLELLDHSDSDPARLTADVGALVLDETTLTGLDEYERFLLRRRIEDEGFVLVERGGGVDVFVRR